MNNPFVGLNFSICKSQRKAISLNFLNCFSIFYFSNGEFSLSIQNTAFSDEVVEPTCHGMPQSNAEQKNNRGIKPFTNIVVPHPINEMYPICMKLVWLLPLFFAIGVVLVYMKYYKYSPVGFAIAFMIIFGFIYQVTSKFNGKRKFMKWLKILSVYSGIDCISNLKLATAIQRYEEDPVLLKEVRFLI